MNLGVDIIYIINLPSKEKRKEKLIKTFEDLNITNYEFIEAISGKDLPDSSDLVSQGILNHIFVDPNGLITKNIIACALSHKLTYKTFLDSNYETCLILEDDVFFTKEFYHYQISGKLDILINQIKKIKYDIILWGKHGTQELGKFQIQNLELYKPKLFNNKFSAHSYQLNRKSAEKLLKFSTPIRYAADICLEASNLKIYSPKYSMLQQYRGAIDSETMDKLHKTIWKFNQTEEWASETTFDLEKLSIQYSMIPINIPVDKVEFKPFKSDNNTNSDLWAYIYLK